MAPKGVNPLTQAAIETLVASYADSRNLPTIVLPSGSGSSASVDSVCLVYVVYLRAGGFMIAVPNHPEVHACLVGLELELGLDGAVFYMGQLPVFTNRGNSLGSADVELVDLPWGAASAFFPVSSTKSKFRGSNVIQFTVGVKVGVLSKESVLGLADAWIASEMEPATAGEYTRLQRRRTSWKLRQRHWALQSKKRLLILKVLQKRTPALHPPKFKVCESVY